MTSGKITNIAASVHQRLLNKAREFSRPFNEILQHFAIERFIYRLSMSPHADRFILKGALMFPVWSGPASRSTLDIDLLGRIGRASRTLIAQELKRDRSRSHCFEAFPAECFT